MRPFVFIVCCAAVLAHAYACKWEECTEGYCRLPDDAGLDASVDGAADAASDAPEASEADANTQTRAMP